MNEIGITFKTNSEELIEKLNNMYYADMTVEELEEFIRKNLKITIIKGKE